MIFLNFVMGLGLYFFTFGIFTRMISYMLYESTKLLLEFYTCLQGKTKQTKARAWKNLIKYGKEY